MHLPKTALCAGGLCRLPGFLSMGMNTGQRIVPIDNAKPLTECRLQIANDPE